MGDRDRSAKPAIGKAETPIRSDSPRRRIASNTTTNGTNQLAYNSVLKKNNTDQTKLGKPSIVDSLTKLPEKDQNSIQKYLTRPENKRKINEVIEEVEENSDTESPRSPKIRKMSSQVQQVEQLKINPSSPSAQALEGNLSVESLMVLQRLEAISKQMESNKLSHSEEIKDLKNSINTRIDQQDIRLVEVESKISAMLEEKEKENLVERVSVLENVKGSDALASNEYLADWLFKVTNRLENKDKEERKYNIVIKGLEIENGSPQGMIETFLTKHFKIMDIRNEIVTMKTRGNKEQPRYVVTLKNLKTKKLILESKSNALKGLPVFIEHDNTPLEHEISWRARKMARDKEADGHKSKAKNKKVMIDDVWHVWDMKVGRFIPEPATSKPASRNHNRRNVSRKNLLLPLADHKQKLPPL